MGSNYHTTYSNVAPKTNFTVASMGAPLLQLDTAITYEGKKIHVSCDGAVVWVAGTLTWTGSIHIYFNSATGVATHNSIAAASLAISDSEFAYVTLSETNNAVLTMAKAAITTGSASNYLTYNVLVLGYRNASNDLFYPTLLAGCMLGTNTNKREVVKASTGTFAALDLYNTIINNYGQSTDTTLTLLAAGSGMSFVVVCGTTVAKYFRVKPAAGDKIYLDGVALTDAEYVGLVTAAVGSIIMFYSFQTEAAAYDWIAVPLSGAWAAESAASPSISPSKSPSASPSLSPSKSKSPSASPSASPST